MAKQAAIFRRVAFGQGRHPLRGMAFGAELFRLFFLHLLKPAVNSILGQLGRGLFRGVEQEEEDGGANDEKGDIQVQGLDSSVCFGRHDIGEGGLKSL